MKTNRTSPIVSVIIPVFNAEKYLYQCLDSVINQTFSDIEIICINDGSIDNSLQILTEFREKDSRIKVISQENRGAGDARNTGLSIATGKYLSFLDADDFFETTMFEKCVSLLEKENSDILIFSANQYDDKTGEIKWMPWSFVKESIPDEKPFSPLVIKDQLFNSFQNWTWNKIFRKSFIDHYKIAFQSISRTNDMAFVCEALARAHLISVLEDPLAYYRIGTGQNLQSTNHLAPHDFWYAYIETKRRLESANLYSIFQHSFLNWVLDGALHNMRVNKVEFAYLYVSCLLKYRGEKDFGFLEHNREYYNNTSNFDEYIQITNAKTPLLVDQLRQEIGILNNRIVSIQAEQNKTALELAKAQDYLSQLLCSTSFKIGSLITFVPGKIKRLLKGK